MRSKLVGVSFAVAVAVGACGHPRTQPQASAPDGSGARVADAGASTADANAAVPVRRPTKSSFDGLGEMNEATACAMASSDKVGAGKSGAKEFRQGRGSCLSKDPFCDTVDVGPPGGGACFVANTNVTRAERESRGRASGPALASAAWDPKKSPKYWDKVDGHLHFDAAENALLRANGFVVLDRERHDNYAQAYHDVFQQQLPLYVSVDSVFHAVFRATETLLAETEKKTLGPKLARAIDRMRATLAQSRGVYDADTLDDLDLYLVVAHRLLHTSPYNGNSGTSSATAKKEGVERTVTTIVEAASAGTAGLTAVEMFGRPRMIDFSQYTPRGHYANSGWSDAFEYGKDKEQVNRPEYFRAMTWLSRLEWNLVSRSCRSSQPGAAPDPTETPREARDAIALADLVVRSGVSADLEAFEGVYSVFGGKREDVPLTDLHAIATKASITPRDPEAQAKLKAAIGDGYKRTARTHFMPEGSPNLPAIATMFGSRIVADIAPLTHLVHDSVPDRYSLGAADVAYVLGHDRAKNELGAALKTHPELGPALDRARADVAAGVQGKTDIYSTWLSATLHLADTPKGALPTFMRTPAYADLKRSSALAAYAQIRHTYVLLAAQGYDAYGCEIPDGYVEPALASWDGLLAWVRAAKRAVPSQQAYFRRVEEILVTLRGIAATELAGAALSEPQRRWLGMVAEITPVGGYGGDSGEPPKYTGWYFDLFPDREIGAQHSVDVVADYFTLTNLGEVRYLGVERVMTGAFVVDVNGEPRIMVGPVTRPYEAATKIDAPRLDDEAATKIDTTERHAPWLASYVAPEKEGPAIDTRTFTCGGEVRVVVVGADDVGDVSVTLLDHHGDPITEPVTQRVGTSATVFSFSVAERAVEGAHVRVGALDWSRTERVEYASDRSHPMGIGAPF